MSATNTTRLGPVALALASNVREPEAAGAYDKKSATWSDRNYAMAHAKKHCESR